MSGAMQGATAVALALVGAGAWTFGEYVIHRFLMHELRGRGLPSREHLLHHADPEGNPGRPLLSWIGIAVVGAVLFVPAGLVLGHLVAGSAPVGLGLYGGWLVGYGVYERIHERSHSHPARGRYGRLVRRHHFHHHHGHPLVNHGVTTPLWDRVFGTLERPTRIRVPRRQAMAWLLDADGEVRVELRDTYELVGPADADARQRALDRARAFANLPPACAPAVALAG